MKVESGSSGRITKNTSLLYFRMLLIMAIDLYLVRIVLNSLGAVDYGIFDVVAGIVLMFQSVSSVLVISTQRFYSYAIGKKDDSALKSIFSSSFNIYILLSLIILVACETVGVWLLNNQLTIPLERQLAANWVFQFSILSFIFSILQIPFLAAVIANEDMGIYSVLSILNCLLKLVFALFISSVSWDRLVYYGSYLLLIALIIFISYAIVGFKRYNWCRYSFQSAQHHKEIISFSGWTFCGTIANVGMTQFCSILVNAFFGPIVNAARAISFQINNAINAFCGSFLMAIRPPMIKAYAEGNYVYLNKLFESSNKIVYYLLLMVCLPLFFEMDTILFYWLKTTDYQTVLFARLIVIYALVLSLNSPITFIIHATGHVKEYHTLVEIPTLLCAPLTYLSFKMGASASSTYIIMITAIIVSHIIRVFCLKKYYLEFDIHIYIKSFCIKAIFVTTIVSGVVFLVHVMLTNNLLRLFSVCLFSILAEIVVVWLFALKESEKKLVVTSLRNIRMKYL